MTQALAGRRALAVAALLRQIEVASGVRTMYSPADLRNPSAIEQMMAMAHETFGAIDILINNAVVRHVGAIESMPPDHWDEDLAVNLSAAFHTIRLVLPGMKARKLGVHRQRVLYIWTRGGDEPGGLTSPSRRRSSV